jgi:catechol 2,3-dioxygenase-like lactoylglutathione lyase family enzyme
MRPSWTRAQSGARWVLLALLALTPSCQRPASSRSPRIEARTAPGARDTRLAAARVDLPVVRELALSVSDLDRSVAFFRGLDFVPVDELYLSGPALEELVALPAAEVRVARLRLGSEHVELREFIAPRGRPIADDTRSNDQAFQHLAIVVRDMNAAYARVQALGAAPTSPQPQTLPRENSAAAGIRAFYFKDGDRHDLELIWFPPGKGRARWQAYRTGTFLGIDHSAIAVTDTEQSLPFYTELGLVRSGESLNFGKEQEALSGVPGARVRITGLSPRIGPGVEFLSYLEPGAGRARPPDGAANDLWHWEITVEVADLTAALSTATQAGGRRVSHAPVDVSAHALGYRRAAVVSDRDGHCLRLVER